MTRAGTTIGVAALCLAAACKSPEARWGESEGGASATRRIPGPEWFQARYDREVERARTSPAFHDFTFTDRSAESGITFREPDCRRRRDRTQERSLRPRHRRLGCRRRWRRPNRPLLRLPARLESAVPEPGRWPVRGRHRGGRPGPGGRHRRGRFLRRHRQRRRSGPLPYHRPTRQPAVRKPGRRAHFRDITAAAAWATSATPRGPSSSTTTATGGSTCS